jgi:hypothetical protein
VLPHSDLNAARLPFRHDRKPWYGRGLAGNAGLVKSKNPRKNPDAHWRRGMCKINAETSAI